MLLDQTQGTEMERLWNLLGELSSQLSHNRQQTEELHRRADELRSQAVHSQTGFTLRRFNVDVSKEEFESELERLNVSLVMENQSLQQENRQLSSLLKDYESTLDAVMSKFRAYAHASQQHDLELTRHYESLLLSLPVALPPAPPLLPATTDDPSAAAAPASIDPATLQASLGHLASLIRKAMRSLHGEDPEDSTSPLLDPVVPSSSLFESLSLLSSSSTTYSSSSSPSSSTRSAASRSRSSSVSSLEHDPQALLLASHHPVTARQPRLSDPSSGGYISRHATTNALYEPTTSTSSLVASPPRPNPPSSSSTTSDPPGGGGGGGGREEGSVAARAHLRRKRDLEAEQRRERDELARAERFRQRGLGPLDDALLREVEVEALRRENDELKKLLGIDRDDEDEDDEGGGAAGVRDVFGQEQGAGEGAAREDGERGTGARRGGTRGLLFESGAKPERIEGDDDEDDDEDDEDEDDSDDDKEPELSEADSELLAELFKDDNTSASPPPPPTASAPEKDVAAQGSSSVAKENEENTGEGIVAAAKSEEQVDGAAAEAELGRESSEGAEEGPQEGNSRESATADDKESKA
ncbi:hypothetical protein JCM11491_005523 [Sporobolomyces phaffii]